MGKLVFCSKRADERQTIMSRHTLNVAKKPKCEENKKPKVTTDHLIKDLVNQNKLFYDQYGEPWLSPRNGGSEIYKIGSKKFSRWLGAYVFNTYGFALKNNQVRDITVALEGVALYKGLGEKHLEVRSRLIDGVLWYDLGGSAVRVDKNGWKVIEQPPILFRPYSHQEKQVRPVSKGNIQALRQFVNINSDESWALFLIFMISAFIPTFPKPVLVLTGSQGAGKTTPMRMLKKLIDPSVLPSNGSPSDQEEMSRIADKHLVLFFDNLSNLPNKVSDILCKIVTGDGFSRRTKFTDDDETIFTSKRAVMMNGINSFITRADLLDRAIILEVKRIPEDKRLPEDELWRKFEEERPKILGGIFDILSKAMSLYGYNVPTKLPRMADFAKWGVAINNAIKQSDKSWSVDFMQAYEKNIDHQNEEAIQSNPVAVAAQMLVERCIEWKGTATEFFDSFYSSTTPDRLYLTRHVMWPRDPSGIGRSLVRAETNLKRVGISVRHYREDNHRMIQIFDENRRKEYEETQKRAEEQKAEEQRKFEEEKTKEQERLNRQLKECEERHRQSEIEDEKQANNIVAKLARNEVLSDTDETTILFNERRICQKLNEKLKRGNCLSKNEKDFLAKHKSVSESD